MNKNIDYDYMIGILTALKDGKTIQLQDVRNKDDWFDVKVEDYVPKFNDYEYRIKPKPRTINVRMALMKNGELFYTETVNDTEEENKLEKYSDYFQFWITNWETFEIIQQRLLTRRTK